MLIKENKHEKQTFLSLALLSLQSFAADTFNVVTDFSSVSFATIKKQYVIEPATISGVTGNLDESGKFAVFVPVANIDTAVAIRNERLNALFLIPLQIQLLRLADSLI